MALNHKKIYEISLLRKHLAYDKIYNNIDNLLFNKNYEVNTMTSTGKWRGYQDYLSDGPPFACKMTNMIKKENKVKEKKRKQECQKSYF